MAVSNDKQRRLRTEGGHRVLVRLGVRVGLPSLSAARPAGDVGHRLDHDLAELRRLLTPQHRLH
ncbi:MAG: hypothetical protein ACRDYA_07765 [Egibacteraceae bacterium]